MHFCAIIRSVHKVKILEKKNLNYTSTDKKKLTWRKFVSKDKEKWQVF